MKEVSYVIGLPISKGKTGSSRGFSGAPTITSFPLDFNKAIKGKSGWTAETVSIMPSIVPTAAYQISRTKD